MYKLNFQIFIMTKILTKFGWTCTNANQAVATVKTKKTVRESLFGQPPMTVLCIRATWTLVMSPIP